MINDEELVYFQGMNFYKDDENSESFVLCDLCGEIIDSDLDNHICTTILSEPRSVV